MQNHIESLLKLSKIKKIELLLPKLFEKFTDISEVFKANKKELAECVGEVNVEIIKNASKIDVKAEIELIKKLNAKIVTIKDKEYPNKLKELIDAPPILYVMGELKDEDNLSIAIVGTRIASNYGKIIAEKFAEELASYGITIVSGFAYGIDSCAHIGALKTGRTIAVFACGIDYIYPAYNRNLANEIIRKGACVSEFPLGTKPWRGNFLTRNRIISGLSRAVIAIEARKRSGVFSTVNWALEQGKEVFALPGNITQETSEGTNELLKIGAKIITSVDDVLEFLNIEKKKKEKKIELEGEEKVIFEKLDYSPLHIDKIAEITNMRVEKVSAILLELELKGVVKQLPGRNFIKNL